MVKVKNQVNANVECIISATMKKRLEILNSSYWEHFKYAKELAGYLDLNHPKRVRLEKELNKMLDEIQLLNGTIKH